MTLTLLFRLQAIFMAFWVVMLAAFPESMMQAQGWELTPELQQMAKFIALAFTGIAVISWMMPAWAGSNIKKPAMVMGVYLNLLFMAFNAFDLITGAVPANGTNIGGFVPQIILVVLFYMKSRE